MVKVIIQTEEGKELETLSIRTEPGESDVHLTEEIKHILLIHFDVKELS